MLKNFIDTKKIIEVVLLCSFPNIALSNLHYALLWRLVSDVMLYV